jgi:lipopolysaccharide transport system ATP-binding protein
MSDWAIKVENISKLYRVGIKNQKPDTLFGSIGSFIQSPVKNFKKLRGLSHFNNLNDKNIFWALNDISFDVKKGEAIGIVGPNGAGKSTLLKILSRISEPSFGQARIKGRISSLLEVGTGFHPELTGRDNIYMNGTILGMTRNEIDRKLDQIIDYSGVERHIDTSLKFYSSGMKVRLGFAVAAFMEQEIIIMDEVLAVGDAEFQKKCLGTMENVRSQGRTVLFVSHDLNAIQTLCKRAILLKNGSLVADGNSTEVIQEYLDSKDEETTLLHERKDRSGKGEVMLNDISLVDNNSNRTVPLVLTGTDVSFYISYKSIVYDQLKQLEIGIDIFNQSRRFITPLHARVDSNKLMDIPQTGVMECKIENLPLLSGKYRMDINLYANGKHCDGVRDAFFFEVSNGGYYEQAYNNGHGSEGVYMHQDWKLHDPLSKSLAI